jgi:hypothetical protein
MQLGLPGADKSAVGAINRPLRRVVPVRDIPDIWLKFIIGDGHEALKRAPQASLRPLRCAIPVHDTLGISL